MNPADEQLRDYERQVYRAVLPGEADSVLLSELRTPGRVSADQARTALRADAIEHGLLADRKGRGLAFWLGAILVAGGIAAAIGLALSGGYALVGVAIGVGGLALLLGPIYLPARTAAGRALAARARGLQRGLDTLQADQVPPPERQPVFSRALPFTVIGERADNWIRSFRELNLAYFDAVTRVILPQWSTGRVALVGDAASSLSLFGDGSTLAIIGAYTLAEELGRTPGDIPGALRRYEQRHRRVVRPKLRGFALSGLLLVPGSRAGITARDLAVRAMNAVR